MYGHPIQDIFPHSHPVFWIHDYPHQDEAVKRGMDKRKLLRKLVYINALFLIIIISLVIIMIVSIVMINLQYKQV